MRFYHKRQLFIIILTFCFLPLVSQKSDERAFTRSMRKADVFFYYDGNYQEASAIYEKLLESNPGHSNLQSKLGTCYVGMDGKKGEALRLLKAALKNVVERDRDYSEYGEKASLDTYIYLGIAYQKNDSLKKAIEIFTEAKERLVNTNIFRDDYFDIQINNCRYAMEKMKEPVNIDTTLMVPWLEDYPGACNPVLSANDSVFVFTQKLVDNTTKIYISYNNNGTWSLPGEITGEFGNYDRLYTNSITGDGSYLLFFMDIVGDGNLYYSELNGNKWSRAKPLEKSINTSYWESHGYVTPDGKWLYFSSNRDGGQGDLDIWLSERDEDGFWKSPVNLGKEINTSYNEDTPFYITDKNILMFSSSGFTGMGDYDLYLSHYEQGQWSTPVGAPYGLNSTSSDLFFLPIKDTICYITSLYNEDFGTRNIFRIELSTPEVSDELIIVADTIVSDNNTNIISEADIIQPDKDTTSASPTSRYSDIIKGDMSFNILFGFDSYTLDSAARAELDLIMEILSENEDHNLVISGFSDAMGNSAYNLELSRKRVDAAVEYITSTSMISRDRLILKAYGETNFIAVNTNNDGSDNPEGRGYNRRVTIGILDENTGTNIHIEPYTPEHLKLRSAMRYKVILEKSDHSLPESKFDILDFNEKLFLGTLGSEGVFVYTVGVFFSLGEADEFLAYVKNLGFSDAFVINQYNLTNELSSLERVTKQDSKLITNKRYTIQILASRERPESNTFKEIEEYEEIEGVDGFYRYIYGEYDTITETEKDLTMLRERGFDDAFIRETLELRNLSY